jgi:hypothetical protein
VKKNIAIISSPLQALVLYIIIKTDKFIRNQRFILLIEGEINFPSMANVTVVRIFKTRGCETESINKNLKIIDQVVKEKCSLWISDLFWPMNNIAFARLLNENIVAEVNIIDEGMVLYLYTRLSLYKYIRELFKMIFVMVRCRRRVFFVGINPFHNVPFLKSIYALHPKFVKNWSHIKAIKFYPATIDAFDVDYKKMQKTNSFRYADECGTQVFMLNQPFYRISGHNKYKQLIYKLDSFINKISPQIKYVRMHPSDDDGIFSEVFKEVGYVEDQPTVGCPVEVDFAQLSDKTILISFNSSALLNAKRFGFKGTVVSFGLDWVANEYPMQKEVLLKQESLFKSSGIIVQYAN